MKVAVLFERLGPYHAARLNALARHCEVTAIEIRPHDSKYSWLNSIQLTCPLLRISPDQLSARGLQRALEHLLELSGARVCFIPGWGMPESLAALLAAQRLGLRVVIMSESNGHDAWRFAPLEQIKRWILRGADAGLVGGQAARRYLKDLGVPNENIFLGYDVVDNAYFKAGADEARRQEVMQRRSLNLPDGHYWLAVSRLVKKKNLSGLLAAYARYSQNVAAPWPLVVLGNGSLKEQIEQQARDLGIDQQVRLVDFVQYDKLPAYYGLAGALIHASTTEQWGLVINEAMASGLPVLVSRRCGCVEDLVEDGINGYVFDPYDVESIASSMRRFTALSTEERLRMGAASQTRIGTWSLDFFAENALKSVHRAMESPLRPYGRLQRLVTRLSLWHAYRTSD